MQICDLNLFPLMPPLRDDQYISLSPTDSPGDEIETDLGAAAPGPASQGGQQVGISMLAEGHNCILLYVS